MDVGAHIIVSGLVQGVGFRWFVDREAKKLGLTGHVRNLYTGEVEVVVEGERSLIEQLIEVLRVGNRASHVENVRVAWRKFENKFNDFRIVF